MGKEEKFKVRGKVVEALRDAEFDIELEDGRIIRAYLAGKMKTHRIKILPGDNVDVELSVYELNKGRIVYRHK